MINNKVNHKIPFQIFEKWFNEALHDSKIVEPSAMCLATSDADNKPSARMVLLKKFDEKGFCFYTNLTSRKGHELNNNSNVALCFYWGVLGRQVRIEGEVEAVTKTEADEYFASRRKESRIGAWASKHSQKKENWQ
jgi:pyridoxamine 5'-phosphate oxidase